MFLSPLLFISVCTAFTTTKWERSERHDTALSGISEWREQQQHHDQQNNTTTPLPLLPFPADEALTPGQSRRIVLKEGRFFDMFEEVVLEEEGGTNVVGMLLMGDDGILPQLLLCDILEYEANAGFRGKVTVTTTLRAVGRANLLELTQMKPHMMGLCTEFFDKSDTDVDVDLANQLLADIEETLKDIQLLDPNAMERYLNELDIALSIIGSESNISDCIRQLTAASWAIVNAVVMETDKPKAIAMDDLTARLQLGLDNLRSKRKQVLEEAVFSGSSSSADDQQRTLDGGFE